MTLVSSNKTSGAISASQIASLESQSLIDAGFLPGIYKRYGRMFGFYDLLTAAGNVKTIQAGTVTVIEEQAPVRMLKIKNLVAAAAGNLILELDDDNFESVTGTTTVARVGFTVWVPQKYMPAGVTEDRGYMITEIADGDRTNSRLTVAPITLTGTNKTATSLAADLPAGTMLSIGHSMWAAGGTGPNGLRDFPVTRSYQPGFIRDAQGFDGEYFSHKGVNIELEGKYFTLNEEIMKCEMRMMDQKESAVLWSEENDNPNLTQTSTYGQELNLRLSTRGLFPWLDIAGQKLYYTDAPDFSLFTDIDDALTTQGVGAYSNTIFGSRRMIRGLQDEAKDFIREYSGGSNFWDAASGRVGFTPQVIEYGGRIYNLHVVGTFEKPASYGYIDANGEGQYVASNAAIVVPDAKVGVNKFEGEANVTIPNMFMGYVGRNGEVRRNMIGRLKGLNGMFEGIDIVTDADGFKYTYGSEFTFVGAEWNKMVLIRKNIAKA